MKAYYHARAHEYDDWWLGRGSYAERDRPGWDDKLAVLVEILRRLPPARTLDVACGTGYCHLLEEERVRFLDEAGRVAAELVVVASKPGEGDPRERWEERVLNDGSRWQVFKRVFDAADLSAELGDGRILHEGRWFVAVSA